MGERRTAPCAGYCRASAMWSEDNFAGRASSAVRNDLQNASSDMVGGKFLGCEGVEDYCCLPRYLSM